jgi:hypothetical protein
MSSLLSNWEPNGAVPQQIQKNATKALEGLGTPQPLCLYVLCNINCVICTNMSLLEDDLTGRLGFYLRSSPGFRLFVILYLSLLHVGLCIALLLISI